MELGLSSTEDQLLLGNGNGESSCITKKRFLLSSILKWILMIAIWLFFIGWVAIVFMYPVESVESLVEKWSDATAGSFLGFTGSALVLFSGPILIISVLSALYFVVNSGEEELQEKSRAKRASFRLWTFPVVVDGPFGVVSAAELIGIGLFLVYVMWVAGVYAVQKLIILFVNPDYSTEEKWSWFFRMSGRGCGLTGIFCLSFMLVPVARGSPLLRLLNIPSEHAIRYHIWLGHLCMFLFTCHGFFYLIGWFMSGEIPSELIAWTPTDGANLAGIINIFFGWSIWITSLPFVRPKNFEIFYYTHHLYIIFIIFLAMHVGNFFFCIVAGAIFIFMIDRFLRFCQSRKSVDVISTRCFPCGVVELVMSKPESLKLTALSSIFLKIKEVSLLQWHPFSVATTPLDGKNRLSVLIKACGNWTSELRDCALNISVAKELNLHHSSKLNASVEGPYGYEFSYPLTYEHLILVAGGIGISPFIAVLSDIIHRLKLRKSCLPRNILLIWAVKRSDELSLLSTIAVDSIRSIPLDDHLHLDILIYVTQELEAPLENGELRKPIMSSGHSASSANSISVLASTGDRTWFAIYVISSTIGLIMIISTANLLYIRPHEIVNWWIQALVLLGCMVASVLIFGGAAIRLWHNAEKAKSANDSEETIDEEESNEYTANKDSFLECLASSTTIHYSSRPNFKEIFGSTAKLWGNVDVGVIVCGPQTLQGSVAKECRSLNIRRKYDEPIFHFNSHSFSL